MVLALTQAAVFVSSVKHNFTCTLAIFEVGWNFSVCKSQLCFNQIQLPALHAYYNSIYNYMDVPNLFWLDEEYSFVLQKEEDEDEEAMLCMWMCTLYTLLLLQKEV